MDVQIDPILDFLSTVDQSPELCDDLSSMLDHIDGPTVRTLLRGWHRLKGTAGDLIIPARQNSRLSDIAFRDLADRGDDCVLDELLNQEIEHLKEYRAHDIVIQRLAVFDHQKARRALRELLVAGTDHSVKGLVIDILGFMGDDADLSLLADFENNTSKRIANAAFEARLRLRDPLRLAEHW